MTAAFYTNQEVPAVTDRHQGEFGLDFQHSRTVAEAVAMHAEFIQQGQK